MAHGRLAALFAAGYLGSIGSSGDTNSLTGVVCASLALAGSRAADLGRRWGAPLLLTGLTLAICTHAAFFVYAGIYLVLEAAWFRNRAAFVRLGQGLPVRGQRGRERQRRDDDQDLDVVVDVPCDVGPDHRRRRVVRDVVEADVPGAAFEAEMRKWGVRHLFVWTDETRDYLVHGGRFAERWRGGRWSEFELPNADTRSVVTPAGSGVLRALDPLGAVVALRDVAAGDPVVVRANYYPAWRADADGTAVALYELNGQLAFRAPRGGSYAVRLEYPRYRGLTLAAIAVFLAGLVGLAAWTPVRARDARRRTPQEAP